MKTLSRITVFLVVATGAAIAIAVFVFLNGITNRSMAALDRNPWVLDVGLFASITAFVVVVVGGAVAVARWLALRSRQVQHRDGLYPQMYHGGEYQDLNAPNSQLMAVMHQHRGARAGAASVSRVLDWQPSVPALPEPAAPAEYYPDRIEVYTAPMPRRLALPIGVAGDGRHVALPLRGLGNVVIGGLPNAGKSELLASMAAGLLRQDPTGERQQIAVVDMKLVSFGNLPALAALRWPVATDTEEAHAVVAAARAECARRYEMMREARVRTLEEYQDVTGEPLPYLTVLVDEILDLTQDEDRARRDRFLAAAMDIARKGRAAGVGLVMATQRPSTDVVPSSLRNLASTQIAFKVQRNHDSIAILGEPGAEALPAVPGRCLVKHSCVVQVQAFYAGLEGGRFDAFVAQLPAGLKTVELPQIETSIFLQNQPQIAPVQPVQPVLVSSGPVLAAGEEPPAELADLMRQWYAEGVFKNEICRRVWGTSTWPGKNPTTWAILTQVLSDQDAD